MFDAALRQAATLSEARLAVVMDGLGRSDLVGAMRYASAGGKRLRAFLVLESAALHGVDGAAALDAAVAVECLHAYSLVHDDLPAMDDDDLRRGQPTVHIKWDEATAVLVGDALQSLAFELLAGLPLLPERRVALMGALARAAGARGMVLGQAQDIAAETATQPLTLEQIAALQANKTGALIEWSAGAGPLMAGADGSAMHEYAAALGLAFQIADDILDVQGDAQTVGKAVGKDAAAGKATFVSLLGLEGAQTEAQRQVTRACDALIPYGEMADSLRQAAAFVISRKT